MLTDFLDYKERYKHYLPFINKSKRSIDFIVSYSENNITPVKISFKDGQYFLFGKNFKWITPKIKITDTLLTDYQIFNKSSFENPISFPNTYRSSFLEFNKKKYLLFFYWEGVWCIHHLFDLTDEKKIKYYILNSIYSTENSYGDFNNDGKLDFKQKYFYLRNNLDTSKDKYKIYTIE
ncbi:MAG: hypothetical protein HC854_01810 [Flavobacterium sp.]|nr:hypothetical protein [Flavobacterium sp.]